MEWKEKIKKNISEILWVISILTGTSLISFTDARERIRTVFEAADEIVVVQADQLSLQEQFQYFHERVNVLEHYQEMSWSVLQNETEDIGNDEWFFVRGDGIAEDVDLRKVKGTNTKFAFIYGTHEVYKVYEEAADRRYYIMLHDTKQNYYLFKK